VERPRELRGRRAARRPVQEPGTVPGQEGARGRFRLHGDGDRLRPGRGRREQGLAVRAHAPEHHAARGPGRVAGRHDRSRAASVPGAPRGRGDAFRAADGHRRSSRLRAPGARGRAFSRGCAGSGWRPRSSTRR
jgi:hypothetical protein